MRWCAAFIGRSGVAFATGGRASSSVAVDRGEVEASCDTSSDTFLPFLRLLDPATRPFPPRVGGVNAGEVAESVGF